MSISANVTARVSRMKRGTPFPISGFYKLGSDTSVQKAFSRLVKEGTVERMSKGIYVRPKPLPSMPSIKVTASAEQVAKTWAKEHGYKLASQGQEAAYRLGLQTQAPVKAILWSNGPTRQFNVGRQVVQIRHITPQKLRWIDRPEGELLRALVVTPPESVELSSFLSAFRRLSLSESEAKAVVHKLKTALLTQAWQSKLQQLEQWMMAE